MNIAQFLSRSAQVYPNRIALAVGTEVYATYRELAHRAVSIGQYLRRDLRLDAGDRVALFMENRPEYLEVLHGIWWAGLAAVPVNAKLHPRELAYILEHSGSRCCFVSSTHADAAAAGLVSGETIDVGSERYRALSRAGASLSMHWTVPDDVAWLFYTSGTTGRPKGVMISHRNLMTMSLCYFSDVDRIDPDDCIVHAAPLSHGSGLYALPHLAAGTPQVIPRSASFDPAEVFALARHWRGIGMFAAPTMVKRLVDHARAASPALEGLKTIVYGGGPMYVADIKAALATLGPRFAQIYGQGESPMTITALGKQHLLAADHPRYEARIASVGVAQTAVEVRVFDDEDRAVPADEVGEVCVRGDSVMRGYWNDPAATASAMRSGWLHTGDVGSFDEDGFLTLKDRSKDLIISGGSNVYPREVEEALLQHEAVSEVSVIGRPHPEWGEEVVAFVVRRERRDVTPAELDRTCLDTIARFKRPREYRFVEALPKNNYGKVLKTTLREWLNGG